MAEFYQKKNQLIWAANHEILQIEPWGPDSLRMRSTVSARIIDPWADVGALLEQEMIEPKVSFLKDRATICNGAICAEVTEQGVVQFRHGVDGKELLAEDPRHFVWPPARHYEPLVGDYFRIEANFQAYEGERLYGLGQHQHGRLNQKGCVIDLIQRNTEVSIPFLISDRGYGFLWHNPSVGRVELGFNGTRWVAEATQQLDYWITYGESPAVIVDNYTRVTGRPPVFPAWAAGFWQCKLRYRTQEEVLAVAREYKKRGLPLSIIVIDGGHWTLMGDWQFDPLFWPDPAAMVQELETMGVKVMVSVWPTVNALSQNYAEMQEGGMLARSERGMPALTPMFDIRPQGEVHLYLYDATSPRARQFLWNQLHQGYFRHGIKLYWLDADEPEIKPIHPNNVRYHLGHGQVVQNIYPLLHARGLCEGLREEGETEIITLNRSAWAGSQRFGAAVWSGDIDSTFEALNAQVRAGLNIGLSGITWWTTDIGGFKGGDITSAYFRELIVRWFQYGVFCPIFRIHGFRLPANIKTDFDDLSNLAQEIDSDKTIEGHDSFGMANFTGAPNEVWSFGEEAYRILRELLFLRERLKPYILTQMQLAHERGTPLMRPLFFDFHQDEQTYAVEDQFMFGPDLLVAPVLLAGARERDVYLPPDANWKDPWTEEVHVGGQWLKVPAPLHRIPLFLRDDAQLPIR